jgi:hypothetical protein
MSRLRERYSEQRKIIGKFRSWPAVPRALERYTDEQIEQLNDC